MVHVPVRKCLQVARVSVIFMTVVTILVMVERWRGGRRTVGAQETDPLEAEYERQVLEDEARIVPGLGEGGVAAHLTGRDRELGEESEKSLAINVYLSDRIAYNRSLEDHRNPACTRVVYDAELPSASVIIIFHNEPYSVVLRTIWSVVNSARRDRPWFRRANFVERDSGRTMNLGYPGQDPSSPLVYLKEIILVDDNSTLPELKGKLSHYVRTRLPPDLIRILRLPERVGLTRARLAGARYAGGEVLVFLDAHCEGQPDWLRPLLQRIKDAPHAVVMPIIDVVDYSNLYYSVGDPRSFQGLMLARMRGARSARGQVLVFLDAHCEAGEDWLRPLLQRIQHKRDAVVTPLIDVIDQATFQLEAAQEFQVGGFTFMGHFTWIDVPEREKKRRGSDIAPTWSPTMAGGLFAINREYYWELGAYDEQMAGWGGENLEMSFRIWQCGGTLETIPCSRVGHVFRNFHPYGLPAKSDTHGINTARMAEVWMDDYKELFYLHRPDLRKSPKIGDVTHRKILREKLQCKSFEWYLQHVYPEKFVPVRDAFGYGRFRNAASGLCLDNLQREEDASPLGVYPCHETLHGTQYLSLALDGQLRDEERCVELQSYRATDKAGGSSVPDDEGGEGRKLLMVSCTKRHHNQKWRYTRAKQLVHVGTGLCVDAGWEGGVPVRARRCRERAAEQRWDIDYSENNGFRLSENVEPSEAELTLQKLRGQRRISRSLMSYDERDNVTAATVRRHTHKKRKHKKSRKHGKVKRARPKTKNKFILKLVRTLANNSEDHLEVDIHCKHRQLYPNNSFVRDIVTILNDKNIKVINNGRVFERNRVTELVRDPTTMRHKEAKVLEKMDVEQRAPEPPPPPPPPPSPGQPAPQVKEVARISVPAARWPAGPAAGHSAGHGAGHTAAAAGVVPVPLPASPKKRKVKPRPQPPPPPPGVAAAASQAINAINNALEAEDAVYAVDPPPDDTLNDKKIIIEDFVEVKPGLANGEPYKVQRALGRNSLKKRKRKHGRRGDPAVAVDVAGFEPSQPSQQQDRQDRLDRQDMRPERVDRPDRPTRVEAPARPEPRKRIRVPPDYEDDSMRLDSAQPQRSLEELQVPPVSGEVPLEASKRSAQIAVESTDSDDRDETVSDPDADDWFLGDFRRNESRVASRRQNAAPEDEHEHELDAQQATGASQPGPVFRSVDPPPPGNHSHPHVHMRSGAGAGTAPLKVVMKSNLTFNLGDEFFKWRTSDDVADILGELAIPSAASRPPPPAHAWVRPQPPPAGLPRVTDVTNESSSSESADNER